MDAYRDCLRYKDKDSFPSVVVEINDVMEHIRKVSTEEGRELSYRLGSEFVQISRKDNEVDVNRCFEALLPQIGKWNDEEEVRKIREDKKKRFWMRK